MTALSVRRALCLGVIFVAPTVTLACGGGTASAPVAGDTRGAVPDLTGVRVMAFPVQASAGVPGDLTSEFAFALEGRAPEVEWVLPDELGRVLASSPGMGMAIERLPVDVFLRAEVRRVGDPLFGNLLRLAALTDAQAALIPIAVQYGVLQRDKERAEALGDSATVLQGSVHVTAALIDTGNGRVLWFGVIAGEPGEASNPAALASAMDALARRFGIPSRR